MGRYNSRVGFVTVPDVAKKYNVDLHTVYDWITAGVLKADIYEHESPKYWIPEYAVKEFDEKYGGYYTSTEAVKGKKRKPMTWKQLKEGADILVAKPVETKDEVKVKDPCVIEDYDEVMSGFDEMLGLKEKADISEEASPIDATKEPKTPPSDVENVGARIRYLLRLIASAERLLVTRRKDLADVLTQMGMDPDMARDKGTLDMLMTWFMPVEEES